MERMEKQTAVEWLVEKIQEQLDVFLTGAVLDNVMIEKAKEMEKEQIVTAWNTAHEVGRFEGKGIAEKDCQTFETYWKANFKS